MWARMDYRCLNIIVLIFLVLLEVHTGHIGIIFSKYTEIHLNEIKQQIYLKIRQTPRWQLIWPQNRTPHYGCKWGGLRAARTRPHEPANTYAGLSGSPHVAARMLQALLLPAWPASTCLSFAVMVIKRWCKSADVDSGVVLLHVPLLHAVSGGDTWSHINRWCCVCSLFLCCQRRRRGMKSRNRAPTKLCSCGQKKR
jgi:hypothetical protein